MKSVQLLILTLLTVIDLFLAQTCKDTVKFSECTNKAALQVADCSNNVSNVPDSAYYSCMCKGYQSSLTCYSICPDDAQLQLQLNSQKQNVFATCKMAQEIKPESSSTSSLTASSTSSPKNGSSSSTNASESASSMSSAASTSASATGSKKTTGIMASGGSSPTLSTNQTGNGYGQEINPPQFSGISQTLLEWQIGMMLMIVNLWMVFM